ncbi:hypothetical protein RJ55_08082 [Drechmeria coniospora]|nr:hypothetical protein RJ55_08082 [Drechmeria coniospora]
MAGEEDIGSQNSAEVRSSFTPLVTVIGFHHARGPEVESWFGADDGVDPAVAYDWGLLPFMALSDGAHASEEDFSYFTLLRPRTESLPATSLFGISCTRQLHASQLINRPADVTRSTVQKAVVVIADSPHLFGMLRERLSIVTQAWFAQRDFADAEILRRFQESLAEEKERGVTSKEIDRGEYLGMSLRELIHEFKWQTLVLLKCCLLQPKMLFFGSRCDRLCMVQFSLISLIPGLLHNLQDCADPELANYEKTLVRATSLQSSNRSSLLSFMGLPLQIFGKGSFFGPYTPLQQLDILADHGTKSYLVGSTNCLLLQQKNRYCDVLINLDEDTVNVISPSLKSALTLTAADRRWIDYLTQEINETWDEANPSRPSTMKYVGSEEFIRSQFESYILGLISAVKFHNFLAANPEDAKGLGANDDPATDFGLDWVNAWIRTENYRIWNDVTDSNLFAVSEPKHPCAGGLTVDDVQRRIAEQVKDLHLDERFAQGREILGRNIAVGREKASTMFNKLYSDMEYLRESQRRRGDDVKTENVKSLDEKQQAAQSMGSRATAYMSSWASWAGEKRKTGGWGQGWGKKPSPKPSQTTFTASSPVGKGKQVGSSPRQEKVTSTDYSPKRPPTQASFSESILSESSELHDAPKQSPAQAAFSEVLLSEGNESHEAPPSPKTARETQTTGAAKAKDTDTPAGNAKSLAVAGKNDGFQSQEVVGTSTVHHDITVDATNEDTAKRDIAKENSTKPDSKVEDDVTRDTTTSDSTMGKTTGEVSTIGGTTNDEDAMMEDSAKVDVTKQDATKDATKQNFTKDVTKEDVTKENVTKEDVTKENVTKQDVTKEDATKEDVMKQDVTKEDSKNEDSTKGDSLKEISLKEDSIKEQSLEEDSIKEKSIKMDTIEESSMKEDSVKEDSVKEDSIKEDSVKEDSAKEDSVTENSIKEDSKKENSVNESSLKGDSMKDSMKEDSPEDDSMEKDSMEKDPTKGNTANEDPTKEESTNEDVIKADSTDEDATKDVVKEDTANNDASKGGDAQEKETHG